jgi:hypothetical protein
MVNRAIDLYDNRPLGQNLTYAITQEVGQYRVLLSELRDSVHGTWVGLLCTLISSVCHQVFRERWDGDELGSLKRRLCDSRNSLESVLMVLNSYVFFIFRASPLAETRNIPINYKVLYGWSWK